MMGSQERILRIYNRLLDGETLVKQPLAEELATNVKNVQRDMDIIKNVLSATTTEYALTRPHRGQYQISPPPTLDEQDLALLLKLCRASRAPQAAKQLAPKLATLLATQSTR